MQEKGERWRTGQRLKYGDILNLLTVRAEPTDCAELRELGKARKELLAKQHDIQKEQTKRQQSRLVAKNLLKATRSFTERLEGNALKGVFASLFPALAEGELGLALIMANRERMVEEFCAITASSAETAEHYISLAGSVPLAVQLFMEVQSEAERGNDVDQSNSNTESVSIDDGTGVDDSVLESPSAVLQLPQPVVIEDGDDDIYSDQPISPSLAPNLAWRSLKRRTFDSLFRPPVDLMFHGTWENARTQARSKNRWLLLNIQDPTEFSCQVLNRDIWSHSAVRDLVSNNFVFYQVIKTSATGHRLSGYYNVDSFPFVGIVDPRTGQFMAQLNTTDAVICCEKIASFLEAHPSPSGNFTGTFDPDIVFLGASSPSSTNGTQVTHEVRKRLSDISLDGKDVNKKQRIEELVEAFHEASSSSNGSVEDLTWKKYIVEDGAENASEQHVTLIFRFSNGSKSICRFLTTARLKDVCAYVEQRLQFPARSRNLALSYPRRVFTLEHGERTLAELELNSQEVIDFERRTASNAVSPPSSDN